MRRDTWGVKRERRNARQGTWRGRGPHGERHKKMGGEGGTVAIIQARMGSTRLPGKVLLDIEGQSMLARVVRRVQRALSLDTLLVATTIAEADEALVEECRRLGVAVFRGQEEDVLDRFYQAACQLRARAVARVTADCPLIDPGVIDRVVAAFHEHEADYASNTLARTYPRGLDIEVVAFPALERAWQEATEPYERAHVTPYLYKNPAQFRLLSVTYPRDCSRHRWTVDTPEDLAFVREVYRRLRVRQEAPAEMVPWLDVLALVEADPALVALNRDVRQKVLQEG